MTDVTAEVLAGTFIIPNGRPGGTGASPGAGKGSKEDRAVVAVSSAASE